jgi:integrase
MKGHVRKRGKGNWYAVLSMREPTGKRRVKFVSLPSCKGKREAQQECARIITEMQRGTFVEPSRATLAQFLERWLSQVQTQVAPRTYDGYAEKVRNNLIPLLGAVPVANLRPEQITEAYAKALVSGRCDGGGGLSRQTVKHMHVILKQALTQARLWRVIANNPADLVKPPKRDPKEMQTIDTDQTAKMIEAARGTPIFVPILLGVLCGVRRGEICALRWRSINLETGQLSVVASLEQGKGGLREKQPKNGKGRTVALPPMLVMELRRHRLERRSGS